MKKNVFTALGVSEPVADALHALGINEPTPIQKEAIPAVFAGSDIVAQAQTGTGKTLAFVLPMLEQINPELPHVQALIVTPTRELAIQIAEEVKRLAPIKKLRVLSAYGGQDVERQIRKLEGNIHIIVATPGRLLDHVRRETVHLHKLSMLVLDEADQMLHMGFLPEVEQIISVTPSRRQTLLFSATMPPRIRDLAKAYMKPAVEIEVKAKRITLDEIEQVVIQTTDRGKLDALCKAMEEDPPYLAMIFCRTKLRASKLNDELLERGYSCDELHGDLTQAKREQVMKRFREAKIQFLVATDIAARGLDVEGITHVYNYDIPHDAESYIHRIGRTGRAGQTGKAVTFAAQRDAQYLEQIERGIKMTLAKRAGRGQSERAADGEEPASLRTARAGKPAQGGGRRGRGNEPRGGRRQAAGDAAGRGARSRGTGAARDGGRTARGQGSDAWRESAGSGRGGAAPAGRGRGDQRQAADATARDARGRGAGAARDGGRTAAWQSGDAWRESAGSGRGSAAPAGRGRGDQRQAADATARDARGRGAGAARAAGRPAAQDGEWFSGASERRTNSGGRKPGSGRTTPGTGRERGGENAFSGGRGGQASSASRRDSGKNSRGPGRGDSKAAPRSGSRGAAGKGGKRGR
ncbi:DEAD-box ATP-dependent RNA helicase CshA [Paenibacillus solanacearum]|uniref:DEAD-box ATP-dependent RNA helicase CshA n=1 Tax=Paenibacillus solanacearum TaxID=2048548 RepID=A0A916NR26_9BACL|nr:DEAD/DEAH box helicase [Paenibacillus solanacearum]CAG7635435.1 DEAD-box ATP-dependent RNA helicase CshA [Paenibacillus solanacearum]